MSADLSGDDVTAALVRAAQHLVSNIDADLVSRINGAISAYADEQEDGWRIDVLISSMIDTMAYLIAHHGATDIHTTRGLLAASATALSLLGNDFIIEREREGNASRMN